MINNIDSSLSLQRCADLLFSNPSVLSSSTVSQLLKKAGDLHINSMLNPIFNQYYKSVGYSDIVTNELIDQHCRYYNIEAIAELYATLRVDKILFSKSTYEKFLLSLLRSIQYDHVCLTITKEMLKQGYFLSSQSLFKALSLPAVCSSELFISILSIGDSREIPLQKIPSILSKRLIKFSKANREISVFEMYKYLSITASHWDKTAYLPYLTKSLKYWISRSEISNSI